MNAMRFVRRGATAVVLGCAVASSQAAAQERAWTTWEVNVRDDLSGRRVVVSSQAIGATSTGPFVALTCTRDYRRGQFRDGQVHTYQVFEPMFKIDDEPTVTFQHIGTRPQGITFSDGYEELADGLRRGSVLRYSMSGGPTITAPLRGSTAAMARYDEVCAEIVGD